MQHIFSDELFYDESGGGVTVSGGEPLCQPEFVSDLMSSCRSQGIHVALDTCGHAPPEVLLPIAELADLVLYDLKVIDPAIHERYTGVDNALILENVCSLSERGTRLGIRIPLIPGINDDEPALHALAAQIAVLHSVEEVRVLPYHPMGEGKLRQLGLKPADAPFEPPSPEAVKAAVACLTSVLRVPVRIGG